MPYSNIEEKMTSLLVELMGMQNGERLELTPRISSPFVDSSSLLELGPLKLDLNTRQVIRNSHSIHLPTSCFDYLMVLLLHSPAPVSYEDLVREVQGFNLPRKEARDIARWYIYQIRKVVEPDIRNQRYILNVRNVGYRLALPVEPTTLSTKPDSEVYETIEDLQIDSLEENYTPSSITILVIDQNCDPRKSLIRLLEKAGYVILCSDDTDDALRVLQTNRVDTIIVDIFMPMCEGIAILNKIHQITPDIPIFIYTDTPSWDCAISALKIGVEDYILKSANPIDILNKLNEASEKQRRKHWHNFLMTQMLTLLRALVHLDQPGQSIVPQDKTTALDSHEPLSRLGGFILDPDKHQATLNGQLSSLTPTEFNYLSILARHANQKISYQDLVYETNGEILPASQARNLACWHIHQIRKKLEPNPNNPQYLLNARGYGYRLVTERSEDSTQPFN